MTLFTLNLTYVITYSTRKTQPKNFLIIQTLFFVKKRLRNSNIALNTCQVFLTFTYNVDIDEWINYNEDEIWPDMTVNNKNMSSLKKMKTWT